MVGCTARFKQLAEDGPEVGGDSSRVGALLSGSPDELIESHTVDEEATLYSLYVL